MRARVEHARRAVILLLVKVGRRLDADGDARREEETLATAAAALQARIDFWDGVNDAISGS